MPQDKAAARAASIALVRYLSNPNNAEGDGAKNLGAQLIHVAPNGKNPAPGCRPATLTDAASAQLIHRLEHTDDNIGIKTFYRVVDIDVDADDEDGVFRSALLMFLPKCSHVWGRGKRTNTHFLYVLSDNDGYMSGISAVAKRLKYDPEFESVRVEVRGGLASSGSYTVMPPSTHPSGDQYEWGSLDDASSTPATVALETLLSGLRMAAAATILARVWTEGNRQHLVMALAGFLFRLHSISSSTDLAADGTFLMDRDISLSFARRVMELAGDTGEIRTRSAGFTKTWDKAKEGGAVTGATTLGEITGDPKLKDKLYKLLSDSPDIETLESIFATSAFLKQGGAVVDLGLIDPHDLGIIRSKDQFDQHFAGDNMYVGGKVVPMSKIVRNSKTRMKVNGITLMPGEGRIAQTGEGLKANLWRGWGVDPWPEPVTESELGLMPEYVLRIVGNGDPDRAHYVWTWLADIVQMPNRKPGVAIVLEGEPGSGKSWLGWQVVRRVIGARNYVMVNSTDRLVAKFNSNIVCKLLIQCEEITSSSQRKVADIMKSLLTHPTMELEKKGHEPQTVDDYSRYLLTSNHEGRAIQVMDGLKERRYTVFRVSSEWIGRHDIWTEFARWLDDDTNVSKLFRYLLDYKYDKTLPIKVMQTAEKISTIINSISSDITFLTRMVVNGHPLLEGSHQYWFDAIHGDVDTARRSGALNAEQWPDYVHYAALVRSDVVNRKNLDRGTQIIPLNEQGVGELLKRIRVVTNDFSGADRIKVKVSYINRDGSVAKTRIWLNPMPSMLTVATFLDKHFGTDEYTQIAKAHEAHEAGDVVDASDLPGYVDRGDF